MFGRLEESRLTLEKQLGDATFLKAYKIVQVGPYLIIYICLCQFVQSRQNFKNGFCDSPPARGFPTFSGLRPL